MPKITINENSKLQSFIGDIGLARKVRASNPVSNAFLPQCLSEQ
jgi:hypothetical protein